MRVYASHQIIMCMYRQTVRCLTFDLMHTYCNSHLRLLGMFFLYYLVLYKLIKNEAPWTAKPEMLIENVTNPHFYFYSVQFILIIQVRVSVFRQWMSRWNFGNAARTLHSATPSSRAVLTHDLRSKSFMFTPQIDKSSGITSMTLNRCIFMQLTSRVGKEKRSCRKLIMKCQCCLANNDCQTMSLLKQNIVRKRGRKWWSDVLINHIINKRRCISSTHHYSKWKQVHLVKIFMFGIAAILKRKTLLP